MCEESRDRLEARTQTKAYLHAELALEEALDPMTNRIMIMEQRYGEEDAEGIVAAFLYALAAPSRTRLPRRMR